MWLFNFSWIPRLNGICKMCVLVLGWIQSLDLKLRENSVRLAASGIFSFLSGEDQPGTAAPGDLHCSFDRCQHPHLSSCRWRVCPCLSGQRPAQPLLLGQLLTYPTRAPGWGDIRSPSLFIVESSRELCWTGHPKWSSRYELLVQYRKGIVGIQFHLIISFWNVCDTKANFFSR